MDRYPKPIDPTRGTLPRRLADIAASAGAGGVLALLVGNAQVDQFAGLLSLGLMTIGAGYIVVDEVRLLRFDSRAWTTDQWHLLRQNEYRRREGIFLIHTATPTDPPPDTDQPDVQWWEVTVRLAQHHAGPLSRAQVREVEYSLGPHFTEGPVKVQDATGGFPYTTDLYGSLMVLARVMFRNRLKRPLLVERYIDLPESIG